MHTNDMYYLGKDTSNYPKRKERKTERKKKRKKRREERRNKRQGVVTSSSDGVNVRASPCWQIIVARFRSLHWLGSCARCSSWNSAVTCTIINIVILVDWGGGGVRCGNKTQPFFPFVRETRGKEILMIFWRKSQAKISEQKKLKQKQKNNTSTENI